MITLETIEETIEFAIEFVIKFVKTMEFGFDFATLLSIIGAGAVLIYTIRRENKNNLQNNLIEKKKNLQKEKVVEIWGQLVEFKEHLYGLHKEVDNKGNVGPLLTEMDKFLKIKMLPAFAIFATKENIDALANMMDETKIVIDVWGDFCEIADKDEKAYNTVTEAMNKYLKNMIDLDVQLIEYLRNQVHNENETTSKEISKWYKKLK